ncbi:MAC/perforin domain-containing protein [Pedobacter endophyticus]|uniref:MACPF domain-containing protein n=1 Tax=Pedobacter endophyticus TaxID=2789740 RepID=A0A7U3Q5G7_9SPHI|nr:MAC/perforin domain-containing protein [Pedobacter endophyticus]QPH38837.1 hypothetical protein IZT61_17455 [Pedobacter endophyticus]
MKKNYKIKLICLICAFTALLSNCKKGETIEKKGLSGKHNGLAIAGDGKWDLLGHGYDITGELFDRNSASDVSIIDIDNFNKDYPGRIVTPTDTKGDHNVYLGATAYDYVKDVNIKRNFGLKQTAGDDKGGKLYGTSNFSLTNDDQNTYTYNSRHSYATYESWFRIKTINFTGDVTVDLLKNYLTPLFIANLSNYSAEALVERYGTHVLLGIDIGGRLRYDYKGSVVKETTLQAKKDAIKAGFSIGIEKIFSVDLSADLSKEEKTTISNETTEKLFKGTFFGGTNSGTSFTGDKDGNTSVSINLVSWQQSINVNNATLTNINRSVPIYDFISDPGKKQQVKDAVEKYIADRQIKELGEVPIHQYYHHTNQDYLYSLSDNAIDPSWSGWAYQRPAFYGFSSAKNGSIPIYQYRHHQQTRMIYSSNPNLIQPNWPGWSSPIVAFYAYSQSNVVGTVPIYEFYNERNQCNLYSSDINAVRGYSGWLRTGIAFYAYSIN